MMNDKNRIKALEWELKKKEREENEGKIRALMEDIIDHLKNIDYSNGIIKDILDSTPD